MISVIQRFGSDLSLNVHYHSLAIHAVHDASGDFTPIAAPTMDEMAELTARIAERVTRMLERRSLDRTSRGLCSCSTASRSTCSRVRAARG